MASAIRTTGIRTIVGIVLLSLATGVGFSQESPMPVERSQSHGGIEDQEHREFVSALLRSHCFDCHGADDPSANVRLDQLDPSRLEDDLKTWERVLGVLDRDEMPPPDAEPIEGPQRRRWLDWLGDRLSAVAEAERRRRFGSGHRRLTVTEYHHTMQDLFGVEAVFGTELPDDPISVEGYRRHRGLLGLSPLQIECYLDAARQAVDRYVRFEPEQDSPVRYFIEFEEQYYSSTDRYGTRERAPRPISSDAFEASRRTNRAEPPRYVRPLTPIPPGRFPTEETLRPAIPKLHQRFVALPEVPPIGELIVRIRAAGDSDRDGRFPRMRVEAGITLGDGCSVDTRVLGEIDVKAAADDPIVYEFRTRIENLPNKGRLSDETAFDRLSVFDMFQVFISNVTRDPLAIYALGPTAYRDLESDPARVDVPLAEMAKAGVNRLHLDCIEIEMLPGLTAAQKVRWEIDPRWESLPQAERRAVVSDWLSAFMTAAYRRPVTDAELQVKLRLWEQFMAGGESFKTSARETLTAVLVSVPFLFVDSVVPLPDGESSGEVGPYQLASRLSYWLWQAPPDAELMALAEDGSLARVDVLVAQAERLLDDPRSRRFVDDFCRQWLRLDRLRHVQVDAALYPDYDDDLATLSVRETLETFAHSFYSDEPAWNLLDSSTVVVNDRMADHYGLPGVTEGDFRPVSLPEDSLRGGLLTQASLLTLNSDGRDSHPIRRGVWLLERLLHDPPPPPPPNVPELDPDDPDLRGLSLKEQLELHRSPGSCRGCHEQIDPWGIALEGLDATGRRRRAELSAEGAEKQPAASTRDVTILPDGSEVDGVVGLKRYLLQERRGDFTRALVRHLLTYALARPLDHADHVRVEAIHDRFAESGYQWKGLVLAIVADDSFRH